MCNNINRSESAGYYFIILFLFLCNVAYPQNEKQRCATYEYDKYLKSLNPDYAKNRDGTNHKASSVLSHSFAKNSVATVVIPVVVHIIWNTPEQNLPDEQIVSQMDVINEDFSSGNANIVEVPSVWASLVGSSHLFFSLARRDENGNSTAGITRTHTAKTFFTVNDDMKFDSLGGTNAWDRNHFLNIWVCNLENGSSQSILGYGQYPGNPNAETDGIVVNTGAFGRVGNYLKPQYDLGRTATHEIGHWLNLYHTWGDDNGNCITNGGNDDYIADTPDQADATYGCPDYPHISCNNSPDGDMFMDYMDYTDDKCMMLFTADQRSRMDSALNIYRDTLHSAEVYALPLSPLATDVKISAIDSPSGLVCSKYIEPVLRIQNAGGNPVTQFTLDYHVDANSLLHYDWSGSLSHGSEIKILLPKILVSENLHTFIANVRDVNGSSDDYTLDNFKTRSFIYEPGKYSCPVYPETPEIIVQPNPAAESISINTTFKEASEATLNIYNVLGKKVYAANYFDSHGQQFSVVVKGLASGVYFVEVKTFNKQASKKFVVSH